jgi:adsorption protein B
LFVGRAHGLSHVWLSPLRAVVGNYIAFRAFLRATRLYLWNALTGREIAWDKTRHRFPAASRLGHDRRSLADIVTYWGMVTAQELRRALAQQRKTGRPLGLQLLDLGHIDDDSLAQAYGELFGTQSGTFDPLEIPAQVRNLLPQRAAARLTAFVVDRPEPREAIVAVAEPLTERQQRALIRILAARGVREVGFRFAPLSDIAFGIRFGYDDTTLSNEAQAVANLRMQGRITKDQEKLLWRAVRKEYVRLGDIVARLRSVKHRTIVKAVNQTNRRRLGTRLRKMGILTGRQLTTALNSQLSPPIDVFGIGRRTGIIGPETNGHALGKRARNDAGDLGAVAAE